MRVRLLASALLIVGGCIDTGRERVELPLTLAGSELGDDVELAGGVRLALSRAELAFGPLALCAGVTAGALCEAAVLEWRDAAVVDALDPTPRQVGTLQGATGIVRSWMYDHGIVSLLTRDRPVQLAAVDELDGASLQLSGRVTVDGVVIPFRAALRVEQGAEAEQGIPTVRSAARDAFFHEVAPGDALQITFRAEDWFQTANFRGWLQQGSCEGRPAGVICDGQRELTCDGRGGERQRRACADEGLVCVADQGCVDEVVVAPESQVGTALRLDLISGSRPRFDWSGG